MMILLAGLTLGACSSSDNEEEEKKESNGKNGGTPDPTTMYTTTTVDEEPAWAIDWSYNQERPDWKEPEASNYEKWMVMLFKMEDELKPFVDENDLLALFVDDELQGLAKPAIRLDNDSNEPMFLMKVYMQDSDEAMVKLTVSYYSNRLKQIFSRTTQILYQPDVDYGIDEDYVPDFTLGSQKYPVTMSMQLASSPLVSAGIVPTAGDKVAAFVGEECRGIYTIDNQLLGTSAIMTVFGNQAGEEITLRYYAAKTKTIYNFINTVKLN